MQMPWEGTSRATLSAVPEANITSSIVLNAIGELKKRNGSSLADIVKFVSSKYELNDATDRGTMELFLTHAVANGILTEVKGKYKIKEAVAGKKRSGSNLPIRKSERIRSRKEKLWLESNCLPYLDVGRTESTFDFGLFLDFLQK